MNTMDRPRLIDFKYADEGLAYTALQTFQFSQAQGEYIDYLESRLKILKSKP